MTTGPGDERAAAGRDRLRAGHADREQLIEALQAAFVAGMLAKDEFDLRVGQALASRSCPELATLTADLPAGLAGAQPPKPAQGGGARGEFRGSAWCSRREPWLIQACGWWRSPCPTAGRITIPVRGSRW
jgi:Domain of unknown function (DUF1707)